jgi:hypothetical protein
MHSIARLPGITDHTYKCRPAASAETVPGQVQQRPPSAAETQQGVAGRCVLYYNPIYFWSAALLTGIMPRMEVRPILLPSFLIASLAYPEIPCDVSSKPQRQTANQHFPLLPTPSHRSHLCLPVLRRHHFNNVRGSPSALHQPHLQRRHERRRWRSPCAQHWGDSHQLLLRASCPPISPECARAR